MDSSKLQIVDTLLRVFQKYVNNQKKARRYGVDPPLYPAEVHMIMHVANNPEAGVTELAALTGVTKGAVSQMLNRLEAKNLIRKEIDSANQTRVNLTLTASGRRAFAAHERMHRENDREWLEYLDKLTTSKAAAIQDFLDLLETGIDRRS